MKLVLDKKDGGFDVYVITHLETGKLIGQFEYDVDGFCKWWPSQNHGYLDAEFLQIIIDKLNELNAEWSKEVNAMCQDSEDCANDVDFP